MAKYDPLKTLLVGNRVGALTLAFADIERALGFRLPASARKYRAWWANEAGGAHVQALAWMGAGWRVWSVDLANATVRFERANERSGMEAPAGPAFEHDTLILGRRALSLGALRLIELKQAKNGCSEAEAAVALLNDLSLERKKRLLERFPLTGKPSSIDSVDLIREDRDAR